MARKSAPMDADCTIIDDRPIAVRRKRRCTSVLAESDPQQKLEPTEERDAFPPVSIKTPSKAKKKVRFSDPGPEVAGPSLSTGLTPAFSRTTFGPFRPQSISFPQTRPRGRCSLPDLRVQAPLSPSPMLSPAPLSGEIQIVPWCDVMDNRVKRRLRRNHLSEVQNEWQAGKKPETAAKYEDQIKELKSELASLKRLQMHGEAEGASSALKSVTRERELENEIGRLKQEMNDLEPATEPKPSIQPMGEPTTPATTLVVDRLDTDAAEPRLEPDSGLEDQATVAPPQYAEASTQASIQHPEEAEMLRSGRLNLEYLFPGEITLPLVPDNAQELIDTYLERINHMRTRVLIAEDAAKTTGQQSSNIRTQFNKTLEQLDRARRFNEKVAAKSRDENARAEAAEAQTKALQAEVETASTRVRELERYEDEKDRSIVKLNEALKSYRSEVGKLENLIETVERDHNVETAKLKSDMDEAVADLECHVAAEQTGRRDAEAEVDRKELRIQALQVQEGQLRDAVHEKQKIIRNIEMAFTQESNARERAERENNNLHTQMNQLKHNMRASDRRYEQADQMREVLMRNLEEEKAAALRALAACQEEQAHCGSKIEGIQSALVHDSRKRSADVLEHKGLLTPTIGSRYRDTDEIEGMEGLEVQRGKKAKSRKKRPDSGVVILEEDEDEDMVMGDY